MNRWRTIVALLLAVPLLRYGATAQSAPPQRGHEQETSSASAPGAPDSVPPAARTPQPSRVPPAVRSAPHPQPAVAPFHLKPLLLWGGVGLASGIGLGVAAVRAQDVPAGQLGAHRLRAGLTYGLMGASLGSALALARQPDAQEPHRFWLDRWNTPLFVGLAATQVLDYTSTRDFREHNRTEWLLTDRIVDNRAALVATECTAWASAVGIAYILHRTGHHKLERLFSAGYITMGLVSAHANYRYATTGHDLFGG